MLLRNMRDSWSCAGFMEWDSRSFRREKRDFLSPAAWRCPNCRRGLKDQECWCGHKKEEQEVGFGTALTGRPLPDYACVQEQRAGIAIPLKVESPPRTPSCGSMSRASSEASFGSGSRTKASLLFPRNTPQGMKATPSRSSSLTASSRAMLRNL
eukprot:TRINITY_DN16348_c0_g1_i1.p1 TRINITY_DN16348_c0_g1~~TRINITY_DN16348_c0_g1_i1.p1  ORF type:complete len:154 (+),score=20.95 TRINITY_DN16348_c0_g1_i1:78-539(+)